jgi:hypothetical protein
MLSSNKNKGKNQSQAGKPVETTAPVVAPAGQKPATVEAPKENKGGKKLRR